MPRTANSLVYDASDADFETAVVEHSRHTPVVVDFWAEWCGPCRTLGPLLEDLAAEYGGKFVLAKVDVDQNPQLAAAFGVRSIPMVVGFRDGRPLASFLGAQPEAAIRDFLAQLLPSPAEEMVAEARELLGRGDRIAAGAILRDAVEADPRCDGALLALAELAADRDDVEEALELLARIAPGSPERQEADRLAARLRIAAAGGAAADTRELENRLAADPDDHSARFALAQSLAASSRYEEALQNYLEIVRRDRAYDDDAGRKAMLDVFDVLGNDHELTERYRSELAKVLFR
jgi:putative thioredoxin